MGATSTTKTDRAQGVGFVDVESGEAITIFVIQGALEAHVVQTDA
jgi:hypothetical protein